MVPRLLLQQSWARAYVACVVLLAVMGTVGGAVHFGYPWGPGVLLAGLGLGLLSAAERAFPVSFGVGKATFEFGGAPILFALVLGGPLCALIAALPSAAYRDPTRAAFQGSVHAIQAVAGWLVFSWISPGPLLAPGEAAGWASLLPGALAAGLVFFGLDALIGPALMRLKYRLSWREVLDEVVLPALPSDALALATVLAAVPVAAVGGPLAAVVLVAGAFLSLLVMVRLREHQKRALRLETENAALKDALRDSNAELAVRLVGRLGSRDGYAASHAVAAAVYARDVARELGFEEGRAQEVRLAALLMDVGLLWVPDEVLLTPPERLNSFGKTRLQDHPIGSEQVLIGLSGLEGAARWVRWHHERPDGTGYPDRLPGGWIPSESRILAAASFYASLVLDGPHGPGKSPQEARRALVGGMGRAVDEEVARALLVVLDDESPSYAAASDARFSPNGIDVRPTPPTQQVPTGPDHPGVAHLK